MSWKPVFQMSDGRWYDNAQRFATKEEALASAAARFQVWTAPNGYDAHESDELVNYARIDGRDEMINREVTA